MALTMNYQGLQEHYGKPKKKKYSKKTKEGIEFYIKRHHECIKKLEQKIKYHEKELKKLEIQLKSQSNDYIKLLASPLWKKRRNEILELKGNECCICHSKENLQVHHLYYEKNKKPWEYPDDALVVLCKDCHEKQHDIKKTNC